MLKDILRLISKDGFFTMRLLTKNLNVSEELVKEALEQLIRMGYLIKEETGEDCAVACSGCPYAQSCHKEIINTYKITEKAKEII